MRSLDDEREELQLALVMIGQCQIPSGETKMLETNPDAEGQAQDLELEALARDIGDQMQRLKAQTQKLEDEMSGLDDEWEELPSALVMIGHCQVPSGEAEMLEANPDAECQAHNLKL